MVGTGKRVVVFLFYIPVSPSFWRIRSDGKGDIQIRECQISFSVGDVEIHCQFKPFVQYLSNIQP